jgi:cytochrome c-type biogenesis protein CcmE
VTNSKKTKRWLVGAVIIGACAVAATFVSMREFGVYFYTPQEAIAQSVELSNREIRVGGMVKEGTMQWNRDDLRLEFVMTDYKGAEIPVFYRGAPPDMFKEKSGVVVEGMIQQDGSMIARNLLVKHSEEYRKPEDGTSFDHELVKRSILKNETGTEAPH